VSIIERSFAIGIKEARLTITIFNPFNIYFIPYTVKNISYLC